MAEINFLSRSSILAAMCPRPSVTDTSINNIQDSLTIVDIETETNGYGKTETTKENKIISRDDPSDFSNMVIRLN